MLLGIFAALLGLFAASAFDLKTREVPFVLSYGLFVTGLVLNAVESLPAFLLSLATGAACFAFGFFLYKRGAWGGGDAKLFAALGALVPNAGQFFFFPFAALAAALLLVFPFSTTFVIFKLARQAGLRARVFERIRVRAKPALAFSAFFSAFFLFYNSLNLLYFFGALGVSLAALVVIESAREVGKSAVGAVPFTPLLSAGFAVAVVVVRVLF